MHAYHIYRRVPRLDLLPQTEFIDECHRLLGKYEYLMDMLYEIHLTSDLACEKFWDSALVRMNWGLDVLRDFAVYGKIEERGKEAAFKRMELIGRTQKHMKFKEATIQENRRRYEKNWLEHPRMAFEIPKAYLHEVCIDLLSRSRAHGCLCPRVADYFAFTRWLGREAEKVYLYYKQFPDRSDCLSCERKMTVIDRKKLYEAYEGEATHPLVPSPELETGIAGQSHQIRWFFMSYVLGIHLEPGDLVLDLGCWNAGQTVNYAKMAEVIGIDISSGKLRQAQSRRHPDMSFIQCDWNNIPLKCESVDWCIWDEGPEHAVVPNRVLKEIAYVVRKGAVFGMPLAPDHAPNLTHKYLQGESEQWSGGHLHEFTEGRLKRLIERHLRFEATYTIKHSFPGYQWLVGVGLKKKVIKD